MNHRSPGWIPQNLWKKIVTHMPIVSIDLIIRTEEGILLGKRTNKPAKGKWFVPGGRLKKDESITSAVHRIAETEIGIDVQIVRKIGVYEHFYDVSDIADSVPKHYIANAYIVEANEHKFSKDFQHDELKFHQNLTSDIHNYTKEYINIVNASG
jgi:colanic acid biosynthesis protein WcaH